MSDTDHQATVPYELIFRALHDLQAPARHVHSFLAMFRESVDESTLTPDAIELLDAATRSTDEMRKRFAAIRSVLTVPTSMDTAEQIDMAELIASIWSDLVEDHPLENPRLTINGGASIESDRELIGQLVTELLDNSIRFRDPNQTLSVCCHLATNANAISVEIADNGLGIDPERIVDCMEPFHRGRHHVGLGLGLTRCNCIVKTVGCQLNIRSDGVSGTIASLLFPT